ITRRAVNPHEPCPVRADVHNCGWRNGINIVERSTLIDSPEVIAGRDVMEEIVLVLGAVTVTEIESYSLFRAQVDIHPSTLIVVTVEVDGVDHVVLEPVCPAGCIRLRPVLEIVLGNLVDAVRRDDVPGERRARG